MNRLIRHPCRQQIDALDMRGVTGGYAASRIERDSQITNDGSPAPPPSLQLHQVSIHWLERDRVTDRDRFAWKCGEAKRLRKLLLQQLGDIQEAGLPSETGGPPGQRATCKASHDASTATRFLMLRFPGPACQMQRNALYSSSENAYTRFIAQSTNQESHSVLERKPVWLSRDLVMCGPKCKHVLMRLPDTAMTQQAWIKWASGESMLILVANSQRRSI